MAQATLRPGPALHSLNGFATVPALSGRGRPLMWRLRRPANDRVDPDRIDDSGLIALFKRDTKRAWDLFIERYADAIFGQLRGMGFDYDDSMDRFVYVCEKLSDDDCRRMKSIRFAGQQGELVPWVRTVVKNLCVNWAWSREGRKRLFKPIQALSELDQRVFALYFWAGLPPSDVEAQIRREGGFGIGGGEIGGGEVFDSLERIISKLSANRLWKLASGLLQARKATSFEALSEAADAPIEAVDLEPTPEQQAARNEERSWLAKSLAELTPRMRLVIQLRFEQALTFAEIGRALKLTEREVKKILAGGLELLRSQAPKAVADPLVADSSIEVK